MTTRAGGSEGSQRGVRNHSDRTQQLLNVFLSDSSLISDLLDIVAAVIVYQSVFVALFLFWQYEICFLFKSDVKYFAVWTEFSTEPRNSQHQ